MSVGNASEKAGSGPHIHNARLMRRATLAAVLVAVVLIAMKSVVYYFTGSVAMLGTLFDSLLDGSASLLNLFAVRASLTPADDEHRFGHGKAEALAGLGQSIFIFGSAGYIAFASIQRLMEPAPISHSTAGIVVTVIAILLTLALVSYQRHVVSQTRSLAIEADSIHYRGDLLMNLAVIAALILSGYFGWYWADPVFGLVIAALIAWSAAMIVMNATNQLMDRELSDDDRERIKTIALSHAEVVNIHDLRTRTSGLQMFIQFHLELDRNITLLDAHHISDEVEKDMIAAFPGADVLIHQDPAGMEKLTRLQRV